MAEAAGKDPVEFRLALLKDHPRHAAVLKLAAEKAGWGTAPAAGDSAASRWPSPSTPSSRRSPRSVSSRRAVKVEKVVCAVDCGTAINPDQIRAQMEGGIGFGLGAILGEELTLTGGVVDQGNYDSYTPLRIDADAGGRGAHRAVGSSPTGVGEPGVPPIGPALANAVYQATKKRVRVLPFSKGLTA